MDNATWAAVQAAKPVTINLVEVVRGMLGREMPDNEIENVLFWVYFRYHPSADGDSTVACRRFVKAVKEEREDYRNYRN